MLQSATVHPATLALLKKIMQSPALQQFNLVGGTALALQIGHRISIDLDLFTEEDYDDVLVLQSLAPFGELDVLVNNPPFLQLKLDNIKVDFLKFPYPLIQDFIEVDQVRLVTVENIAMMKLLAIARRGSKKDFVDLFFILKQYSLGELVKLFEQKLPHIDMFHILKSLTYFEDAELDADPKMILKASWSEMKNNIIKKVNAFLAE